jgi:hypothetical protein
MSILDNIRQQSNSIDDLAKLSQPLIMQMAQRKQIAVEMVAPILARKAEMIDAVAKAKAMQGGVPQTSVMEQIIAKNSEAEHPQMQQQMMPQQMARAPQLPEEVGIAQNPVPPMQMAGGGIIAFDEGGDVDIDPEDSYEDLVDEAQQDKMNSEIYSIIDALKGSGGKNEGANVGIRSGENKNIKEDTRGRAMENSGDLDARLRAQIMSKESGGRRYDKDGKLLTSHKGAEGEMQVMPYTSRDPGFGIKPARDNSPDELRRVGDEYASAMLRRYRDPKLAMIAYNMGPGATDKWLASGADINKLPKETQGYIRGVNLAQGGEVRHFANTGMVNEYNFGYDSPLDSAAEEDDLKKKKKEARLPDRSLKDAEKALEEQKVRRAAMQNAGARTPVANSPTNIGLRNKILGSIGLPAVVGGGGAYLSNAAANTLAGNKEMANAYFGDEYSDPGSDTAIAYQILNNAKPEKQKDAVIPPTMPPELVNVPLRAPEQKAPVLTPDRAPEEADNKQSDFMQFIKDREAKIEKQGSMDANLALLSAGLGIMGGTSPYAMTNIGQGAQAGVQQLAASQRLRASQDAALNKLYGTAYNANMIDKYRQQALAQDKNLGEAKLNQDMIKAREAHIDKVMKERHGMDMLALGQLRRQRDLGKLDADKLKDLERLERSIKQVEIDALRKYPMQTSKGSSNIIRLD